MHSLRIEPLGEPFPDHRKELVTLVLAQDQLGFDLRIGSRVQEAQGGILQLLLDQLQAQTVCQRRIDLHGFQRFIPLLLGRHRFQSAHIVQTVRQLDDDNPDILCHGKQHFADIFRLLLLPGGKRHLT